MNIRTVSPESPFHPAHRDHSISLGGRRVERVDDPKLQLCDFVRKQLLAIATKSKNEVCGLISVGDDATSQQIDFVTNVHEFPRDNFYFDQDEFRQLIADLCRNDRRIIGMFHSHPNGVPWPSPRDIVGWPNPGLRWRYWVITPTDVIEWRLV
ncbi:major capsid protein [Mycobacterium phage Damien]|uniref:tail protein n=1 Tax=Mycobacterium phage Damien TaxID=1486469 RepID=UPI00045F74F6|nr:tail protein [Mycobacterium phage Damien]AHZ95372.1 major capsid protein [Mycobacterium phage Damien]AXH47218.1 major capsid protein [Mycobacterium phage Cborch11]QLF83977.1 major capsid protein [Mycobacterium phage Beckerton]